ncbi:MAG: hypothetical protein NC177_01665 [Ruminococcus flavefaciens]|nr:hypothetical protein [Ruminococcus flavefaciens]
MHFSDDENNFRNRRYLDAGRRNLMRMFSGFNLYISYRHKLTKELTMKTEEREELKELDRKLVKNFMSYYSFMKRNGFFDDEQSRDLEKKVLSEFSENDKTE